MGKPLSNVQYIMQQGFRCPFCHSTDLDTTTPIIPAGDSLTRGVRCLRCNQRWDEIFVLSGYQKQSPEPGLAEDTPLHPEDVSDDVDVFPSAVT